MSKSDKAKALQHRLAAKLRENLRRRKDTPKGTDEVTVEKHPSTGGRKDDDKP